MTSRKLLKAKSINTRKGIVYGKASYRKASFRKASYGKASYKKASYGKAASTERQRVRKGIVRKGIVHKGIVRKGIVQKGIEYEFHVGLSYIEFEYNSVYLLYRELPEPVNDADRPDTYGLF